MSYISDYKHSEQTEEDEIAYRNAAAEENARDRWEDEDLVIDTEGEDDVDFI